MKIHIVTLLAVATLLSACTDQDWEHALTYTGMGVRSSNGPPRPRSRRDGPVPPR